MSFNFVGNDTQNIFEETDEYIRELVPDDIEMQLFSAIDLNSFDMSSEWPCKVPLVVSSEHSQNWNVQKNPFDGYVENFVLDLQIKSVFDSKYTQILEELASHVKPILSSAQNKAEQISKKTKKMMNASKKREYLTKEKREILMKWLLEHVDYPYPSEMEKTKLAMQTGMTLEQISNWFINQRRRFLRKRGASSIQPPHIKRRRQLHADILTRIVNDPITNEN